jgi:hypothetical protein
VTLNVTIVDVCDQPIPNATVIASAKNPDGTPRPISNLSSPGNYAIACAPPWPITISIDVTTDVRVGSTVTPGSFYPANVVISYDGKVWTSSGAVIIGTGDPAASDPPVGVRIYLCRVRFAPASIEDLSQPYPSDYIASGVIGYSRNPAARPDLLSSPCFDKSAAAPKTVSNPISDDLEKLGYGVWLSLEIGDPPGSKSGEIRQFIGVWAPFRTAETPAVIYQITPHTDNGHYPPDPTIPFKGVYPYGCYDPKKTPVLGNQLREAYVVLPLDRTLLFGMAAYQIYGAASNLYNKDTGPIIITYSPALAAGSVVVEPFDCRETMGRLIGEVLWFLWSNRITGTSKAGSTDVGGSLQTNGGTTTFQPKAKAPLPYTKSQQL